MNRSNVEKIFIVLIVLAVILICYPIGKYLITKYNKSKYEKIVNNIMASAEKWNKDNDIIKIDGKSYYLNLSYLKKEYMGNKKIVNPTDKSVMDGCVKMTYQEVYKDFKYTYLSDTCSNIMNLGDKITDYNNISSDEDGLYYSDNTYYFKGSDIANYVKIDNSLYRIVNLDLKKIKLISNDIISTIAYDSVRRSEENSYCDSENGCNAFVANTKTVIQDSEISGYLNNAYFNGIKLNKATIVTSNQWNIGKVPNAYKEDELVELEKADNTSENVGLLSLSEYYKAYNGKNNYLNINKEFYLLTANSDSTDIVYAISENNEVESLYANKVAGVRPVIYVNYNTMATGMGTKEDPYIIK